jgi:SAM-dependent methyltransferase
MNSVDKGIYEDATFADLDIGAIMRVGHPDIADGDLYIVAVVREQRRKAGRPLRIIDVGAGSGHLSLLLARELADCEVIANDNAAAPIGQARAKLASLPNASVFDRPFEEWSEPVDIVVSWGTHHHLSHDYLHRIQKVLAPDGLLIIGDEFCPEYLTEADQRRLAAAELAVLEDGYLFDDETDLEAYRKSGVVPAWNRQLEQARRRALWDWYKFVGDYAVEKDSWNVLICELQIARDDLITEFHEEHKTSPYLLERELTLNGFTILERAAIGDRPPTLQSFILYICRGQQRDKAT